MLAASLRPSSARGSSRRSALQTSVSRSSSPGVERRTWHLRPFYRSVAWCVVIDGGWGSSERRSTTWGSATFASRSATVRSVCRSWFSRHRPTERSFVSSCCVAASSSVIRSSLRLAVATSSRFEGSPTAPPLFFQSACLRQSPTRTAGSAFVAQSRLCLQATSHVTTEDGAG
jgi:hypothetical protein